jgi:hypothetical protein
MVSEFVVANSVGEDAAAVKVGVVAERIQTVLAAGIAIP